MRERTTKRSRTTAAASGRKKPLILAHLLESRPARIDEAGFGELRKRFGPVSEDYLREILRQSGVPLTPIVEGIRQDSLDELERTLLAMLDEYQQAVRQHEWPRAQQCRRMVITAKDHARFALGRATDAERRTLKQEILLWLLTWLENPRVFPEWLQLRRRVEGSNGPPPNSLNAIPG